MLSFVTWLLRPINRFTDRKSSPKLNVLPPIFIQGTFGFPGSVSLRRNSRSHLTRSRSLRLKIKQHFLFDSLATMRPTLLRLPSS